MGGNALKRGPSFGGQAMNLLELEDGWDDGAASADAPPAPGLSDAGAGPDVDPTAETVTHAPAAHSLLEAPSLVSDAVGYASPEEIAGAELPALVLEARHDPDGAIEFAPEEAPEEAVEAAVEPDAAPSPFAEFEPPATSPFAERSSDEVPVEIPEETDQSAIETPQVGVAAVLAEMIASSSARLDTGEMEALEASDAPNEPAVPELPAPVEHFDVDVDFDAAGGSARAGAAAASDGGVDAMDLVDARAAPAPDDAPALLRRAVGLFGLGDFTGSLALVDKVLAAEPENRQAKDYLARNHQTLQAMYESKIGPLDQVPIVAIPQGEVVWLNLDHRAGFVLSQIDGTMTFDDVLDLCAMPRMEVSKIFADLLGEGVIRIKARR